MIIFSGKLLPEICRTNESVMMNVLLPTDFSENARNAAVYAMEFFKNTRCNFYLLHVIEAPSGRLQTSYLAASPEVQKKFEGLLEWLHTVRKNPDHHFHACFKADFLIQAVRDKVQEKNIDLILMGTKGQTNSSWGIIGKNTSEVMMKVKCPVLAISEKAVYREYKELLFPTDYKVRFDSRLLHLLNSLSSLSRTSVNILELFDNSSEPTPEQLLNRNMLKDYFSPKVPVSLTWDNPDGQDLNGLVFDQRNIDLIVLAARNLRLCQQFLHKNKTFQIPMMNQLPLLVLH